MNKKKKKAYKKRKSRDKPLDKRRDPYGRQKLRNEFGKNTKFFSSSKLDLFFLFNELEPFLKENKNDKPKQTKNDTLKTMFYGGPRHLRNLKCCGGQLSTGIKLTPSQANSGYHRRFKHRQEVSENNPTWKATADYPPEEEAGKANDSFNEWTEKTVRTIYEQVFHRGETNVNSCFRHVERKNHVRKRAADVEDVEDTFRQSYSQYINYEYGVDFGSDTLFTESI